MTWQGTRIGQSSQWWDGSTRWWVWRKANLLGTYWGMTELILMTNSKYKVNYQCQKLYIHVSIIICIPYAPVVTSQPIIHYLIPLLWSVLYSPPPIPIGPLGIPGILTNFWLESDQTTWNSRNSNQLLTNFWPNSKQIPSYSIVASWMLTMRLTTYKYNLIFHNFTEIIEMRR